ncbi:MAG: SDR family oxidoreductase [Pseudonocardiales bacterium]
MPSALAPFFRLAVTGTPFRNRAPERFEQFVERDFPLGRLGTPKEIADVVTFLLSERASWISGTHICVDGAQGRPTPSAW